MAMVMTGIQLQAFPNLNATTGLLAVPTAGVVPEGNFVGAADVVLGHNTTFNGRMIYGLTDRLEIGGGVIADDNTAVTLDAKLALPGTLAGFAPAIGIGYINGQAMDSGTQLYFVGTRAFTAKQQGAGSLLGTVGLNFTDLDSASAFRPFVGGQLGLGARTELDGEYVFATGDFRHAIHSLFIRHSVSNRMSVQAGVTNAYGFTGSAHNNVFIGAAFSWGQVTR